MNIKIRNYQEVQKLQEGGPVEGAPVEDPNAAPGGAPAPQGGEDPTQQILMAAQQAVETQDGQLALQVCQALVEMAGGGAPAEPAAPEGQAPVYKKGGRLSRWIQK